MGMMEKVRDWFAPARGRSVMPPDIRADFMRWLQGVGPFDVDASEMAELLEGDDEWARIERRRDDVTTYLARLVAERPRTLRSVGGNHG